VIRAFQLTATCFHSVVIQWLVGWRLPFTCPPADDRCRQSFVQLLFLFRATLMPSLVPCAWQAYTYARSGLKRVIQYELAFRRASTLDPDVVRIAFRRMADASASHNDAVAPKDCWPRCAQPARR